MLQSRFQIRVICVLVLTRAHFIHVILNHIPFYESASLSAKQGQ